MVPVAPSRRIQVADTGRPGLEAFSSEAAAEPSVTGSKWTESTLVSSKTWAPQAPACRKRSSSDSERIRFQA